MGGDRGIHVKTDVDGRTLGGRQLLKAIVDKEQPGALHPGKQAIDDDPNQTGQMLAALLGWPQATHASKLVINGDNTATVTREVDGGLQTVVKMPFVMTTDPGASTSRAPRCQHREGKKKPIDAEQLGVDGRRRARRR